MTIIKLPEKFNEYDPETLKHFCKMFYLMMLKDFIKVCDEKLKLNTIWMEAVALGAVRHQGIYTFGMMI